MSAELRIVRAPIVWGVVAAGLGAGIVYLARDARAAASVVAAAGLILANALLAALISALAGRLVANGAAYAAMPSFMLRMGMVFAALNALRGQTFIDPPVFAITFVAALTLVLWGESRALARTPWLALTFAPAPRREEP